MEKPDISATMRPSGTPKKASRAARLARLGAIGRAEGLAQRDIDAALASLGGAYALADFVDAIRRAADA
jgi:hypothetical protein